MLLSIYMKDERKKTFVTRIHRCGFGYGTRWYEKAIVTEKDSVIEIPHRVESFVSS